MMLLELKPDQEAFLVHEITLPSGSFSYCDSNRARGSCWKKNGLLSSDESILLPSGTRVKMVSIISGTICISFPDIQTGWDIMWLEQFKRSWPLDSEVASIKLSEAMRWYMARNMWEDIEVTKHIPSIKEVRRYGRFLDL